MVHFIGFAIFLYLALKACHVLLTRSAGYGRDETSLTTRLRRGEPMLALGTFGLCAALALFGMWFTHRFETHWYAYASGCYPRIAAAPQLQGLPPRLRSYKATLVLGGARRAAEMHGMALGLSQEEIDARLERDRRTYAVRYERLGATADRAGIDAAVREIDKCLKSEGAPHGELLRA